MAIYPKSVFIAKDRQPWRWLFPAMATALFFAVILILFPFNSGDSSVRDSIGATLWGVWTDTTDPAHDYTYCLLVPVVVAYILWEKRHKLAKVPIQGSNRAIGWILLGIMVFWIGSKAGKQYIGCIGIQILILGVVSWLWGGRIFRPLLFAWAFLFFAWPWPFIDSTVAFPMRMSVSHLAYYALNFIGIPTIQNGTALLSASNLQAGIPLGDRFQIDIADPCSGIHSLLALLMFSACFSYAFLTRRWHQWLVFLSAMPLVIVGNVCRILMLVGGCIEWGSPFAIGTNAEPSWYHEVCGYLVFVIVLGLECLLGFFLISLDNNRTEVPASSPSSQGLSAPVGETIISGSVPTWRSGVIVGIALILAIVGWVCPPLYLAPQAGVVMNNLPDNITVPELPGGGEFFASDAAVSEAEHRILPKDTEFSRKNYEDFNGHNIYFSIVLSGKQQYVIHPPQVCLVAQGWTITKEEAVPVHLHSGHDLVVQKLSIQRDLVSEDNSHHTIYAYYMYWYVADGVTTPSRSERNWISSRDRIFKNRDLRWAYVIAMSTITKPLRADGLDPAQTQSMLTDFIRQIVPYVQKSEMVQNQRVSGN